MSNLLINEPPLMVLPSLASKIGLNEAIILQQIHYWLDPRHNKNHREGHYWVYNTYEQWKEQFPFWSTITLKRTIQSLEKIGFLISKNLNSHGFQKVKWYRIDYKKLETISKPNEIHMGSNCIDRWDQNDPTMRSNCIKDEIKMICSNIDTETTTEIISSSFVPQSRVYLEQEKGRGKGILSEKNKFGPFVKTITNQLETNSSVAEEMLNHWDKIVKRGQGTSTFLRKERSRNLVFALKSYFGNELSEWQRYCFKIASSKFLMGETKEKFNVKIDWSITPEAIEKILEGTITTGDREVKHPLKTQEGGLHERAIQLYNKLSASDMEQYKSDFIKIKRQKNPTFSEIDMEENSFISGQFKHFILSKIIKDLEVDLSALSSGTH